MKEYNTIFPNKFDSSDEMDNLLKRHKISIQT